MFQSEAYVRPRHGEATDNISARRIFRPGGAEKFAAGGHFSEKLLHTNACSRGKCGRPLLHHLPIVDCSGPAITVRLPAFDAKASNAGNRWQRPSAKTQCNHIFNCIIGQFGGRMTLKTEHYVRSSHARAVVADLNTSEQHTSEL